MVDASQNSFFVKMVDEMVELTEFDPELADSLAWLDKTEKYGKNLNFYDKVFKCLYQHDINKKAKKWLAEHSNQKVKQ